MIRCCLQKFHTVVVVALMVPEITGIYSISKGLFSKCHLVVLIVSVVLVGGPV